jgi:Glycogen recognition site of AMP-activated protein kinase
MIFKRVANVKRAHRRLTGGRLRRVLHPALVVRIAMWVLMVPHTVGAEDSAALNPLLIARLDAQTAQSTAELLTSVFRTQSTEGLYAPGDDGAVLLTRPIFATMALDAYSTTHDTASLAQAANSIARYYSYLFSASDRDGDRLVESTTTIQGRTTRLEDPAFNALLAVDAHNLARVNLELRRPMQALYWYDGARAVERAVVAATFDADDNYCFARDANGQPVRSFAPVAALPAQFSFVVGENHAERMRAHVVDWASQAVVNVAPAERASNAIDFLAANDVLSGAEHAAVIAGMRRAMPLSSAAGTPVERYALARARIDVPLSDDDVVLGLFLCLERATAFSDPERFRIEHALPTVRTLALAPVLPPLSIADADNAIRTAYTTVSTLRERLRTTAFFAPDDKKTFPGVDANIAAQRLLDDATLLLHRAENRLFEMRYASAGVRVRADLVDDRVVVLDNVVVHWEISSTNATIAWKNLSAGVFGEAIAPVNGVALGVSPRAPLRFMTRHIARGATGMLRMITLTAVFENADGTQSRVHFDRSLYLNPPVSVTARFPQGRTMQASTVPVQLVVKRYGGVSGDAKYFWFSPAGLRLAEGNTGLIHFGASDSAQTTLHVEIPSPCRPGLFPFTLKFFAGDRDAGIIASSLFKPYQWTFVGPFAPDGGLDRALPPEQGVNLLQSYPGPNGSARWRPVPEAACDPRGGIALQSLASDRGIHYLYTIVACAYETNLQARLWSNSPAALFVNGRRVATIASAHGDSAIANVQLDPDKNHILVKVIGDRDSRVSFSLGNDDNLAADEFDNNLAELAGGYRELTAREMAMGSPTESRRLVTLRFQDTAAASVAVVGSFNGWSPAMNPMQKKGDVWEITLSLLPGRYSYRFLVNEKEQVLDPSSASTEADGYGGKNSVLVVNN